MSDYDELIRTPLPPSVRFEDRAAGLPRLSVETARASALVYFQGAHLAAWHPAGLAKPVLWTSRESLFEPGKPIRGGVPICFPWFGPHPAGGTAPLHGFARILPWTLIGAIEDGAGTVALEFELTGDGSSPHWPHAFAARHRITVGRALHMELEVRNTGAAAFTFEEALHSYFGVADVTKATVAGLEGTEYLDKVGGVARRRQPAEPVRFTAETDRVYLDTRATCVIADPAGGREIAIRKTGSDATVVWNPWVAKARAMADFGDDEWTGMVCVETCNANVHARTLEPGQSHAMTAAVDVRET
jgi:glucose-6-phosphate 1-epimerase